MHFMWATTAQLEVAYPGCRLDVEPEELVLLAMLVPPEELIGSATQALATPSEQKLVAGIGWRAAHTLLKCCGKRARQASIHALPGLQH